MEQWEYKVVYSKDTPKILEQELNKLGAEGWEVVGIAEAIFNSCSNGSSIILKRRKQG